MRTQCLTQKTNPRLRFFLLMIMPLFIGLLITLSSLAHADWNHEPNLRPNPITQGWAPFKEQNVKSQEFSFSNAWRHGNETFTHTVFNA